MSVASGWPDADALEFVVGASDVRLASLALPPSRMIFVTRLASRMVTPSLRQALTMAPLRHEFGWGATEWDKLAAGVDHLIYGWLFFGVVVFVLFWLGSPSAQTRRNPPGGMT